MSFQLGKFRENIISGSLPKQARDFIKIDPAAELDKKTFLFKRHFGHAADEFQKMYADLHDMGQILNCNYFVKMQPYRNNATKNLAIVAEKNASYLVTETNLPIVQAEFEQVKAGPFQISHLTGITEPDLQLTFLETAKGWISNSMLNWRNLMVNPDGTVNPPASYAVRLTIGLFSKDLGLDYKPVQRTWIVAPNLASIDALNANGVSELTYVPGTFTVLRNFME